MKWLKFILSSSIIVAVAVFTAVQLGHVQVQRLNAQIDMLQREKNYLIEYAERISASRRVAQIDVLEQHRDSSGRVVTTLRWQELGPDGMRGEPRELSTLGEKVYFEALVIKFDQELVGDADPERGVSLALFTRVFGDRQAAHSVPELDRRVRPPVTLSTRNSEQQTRLWERFWQMVDDPRIAAKFGVRVAQGEAPWIRPKAGQVWEITLDAAGGLNLRRVVTDGEQPASNSPRADRSASAHLRMHP